MSSPQVDPASGNFSVSEPALHALHKCRSVEEFRPQFEAATGRRVQHIADRVIADDTPKAIFLVGSLPLGMATSGSDIDLFVMVDSKASLQKCDAQVANSTQQLEYSNDGDALLAGMFVTLNQGVLVDLQVVITPEIRNIQQRLRRRGPELSESEIRTLGRLSSGWLLWQSEGYLDKNALSLRDPAFSVYVCTKHFVSALIQRRKATRTLDLADIPLTLQLGRSSVEMVYLAYFASEGLEYLGAKWLAQIGHAHGAAHRVRTHPVLLQGVHLLFPAFDSTAEQTTLYLQSVSDFLATLQDLIEQKILFRIAFKTCPQIGSV